MISVEQALEHILGNIPVLEPEEKPVLDALYQVTAEDIYSSINIPPLDNSAMDGYAVRAEDTRGASSGSPRVLQVIDLVQAGSMPSRPVEAGTAVRIMTGAPVPEGADCVIRFEDTDEQSRSKGENGIPDEISILVEGKSGTSVRNAGEIAQTGALALKKGTVLSPAAIGLLASLGCARVRVHRRPVVAVMATGNEIVPPGEDLPAGKIYNSNSYSIASLVKHYGGIPKVMDIAADEHSVMKESLQKIDADLLITIGGVSMGDYDLVKNALSQQGEVLFWKVRMKPGKPLVFGLLENGTGKKLPHLGLAGNTVSCMVNFELFGRPSILRMLGRNDFDKRAIEAIAENRIENSDGRRVFARVIVEKRNGTCYARLTGHQGSGILTSMVQANGLAIVPEDTREIKKGENVKVLMLDWITQ